MLIYSGLKSQFDKDVLSGMIGAKIEHAFYSRGLTHNNDSEFASWENSLREMYPFGYNGFHCIGIGYVETYVVREF